MGHTEFAKCMNEIGLPKQEDLYPSSCGNINPTVCNFDWHLDCRLQLNKVAQGCTQVGTSGELCVTRRLGTVSV